MKTRLPRHLVLPLVIAIALSGTMSPLAVAGDRHAQSDSDGTSVVNLAAVFSSDDGAFMGRYIPLDDATLSDRAGMAPLKLGAPTAQATLSPDGSTLVAIKGGTAPGVVVWDARTGEKRDHFDPLPTAFDPRLSRDGARLVVAGIPCCGSPQPPVWYVLDMTDGSLIAEAAAEEPDQWADLPGDIPPVLVDPEARNLYRLVVSSSENDDGPGPVTLVAYDLATGEERGRVALPGVLGGSWATDRVVRGEPVEDHLTPGFALSPDGRTIAVVHADTQAVTLIDAERLTVTETIQPRPETGRLDRILEFLSLAPRSAAAKQGSEGSTLRAVFGPDGEDLYVFGTEGTISEEGFWDRTGLGLKRVNLDSGTTEADALAGEIVFDMVVSPDGKTLYVLDGAFTLRRLSAETLSVEAERTFGNYTSIFVALT